MSPAEIARHLVEHFETGSVEAQFAWDDLLDAVGRAEAWRELTAAVAARYGAGRASACVMARDIIHNVHACPGD